MFGSILNSVANTIDDFIDDPIGETVRAAVSPVTNSLDFLEGLTEGEIRTLAAVKVGADVAAGMAMSELIDVLTD